jgi:membrane protease YdiL (CAAX protease family)
MKLQAPAPLGQLALVLVVFPLLYVINARMPWAQALWVEQDKSWFVTFWSSILLLHTVGSVLVVSLLRRGGESAASIGFHLDARRAALLLLTLVAIGLLLVGIREVVPYENVDDLGYQIGWPADQRERLFWIVVCVFAGVCEELVFRGYAIPALRSRGLPLWAVVLLSNVSFALIHGAADPVVTTISFVAGLVFTAVYLWRRSLATVMVVHALADLTFIVTP